MSTNNTDTKPAPDKRAADAAPRRIRKGRALAPFLAFVLVGFAVHLLVHQLNAVTLEGFPLGYYLAAQAAPIILATIAFWIASRRARAHSQIPADVDAATQAGPHTNPGKALVNGLAASGELLSGAFVVGLTGVAFAQGYDGLAYTLGIICGLIAMSLFVFPSLAQSSSNSLTARLSSRYNSPVVTSLCVLVLALCLSLLLAAELQAVSIVLTRTMAVGSTDAILAAALLTVLVTAIAMRGRAILKTFLIAVTAMLLIATTASTGLLSWSSFQNPLPQFGYGLSLQEIAGLEVAMRESGTADAISLKQHLRPRLHFDAVNFFAILACLTFGLAVLPLRALFDTERETPKHSGEPASMTSNTLTLAWAALFIAATLITIPAAAAFAKLELYRTLSSGIPLATLPTWAAPFTWSGLLTICAQTDLSASNLVASCAGSSGTLILQDISLNPDAVLLALPEFGNQPAEMFWALAAVICTCALIGAARLLTVANAEFNAAASPATKTVTEINWSSILWLATMVFAAALIAATANLGIVSLISWSACLAASTLFPALVIGHLWPRVSPVATTAAMITGALVCIYYAVGTTYFPVTFANTWQAISSAPQWQLEKLETLSNTCAAANAASCAELKTLAGQSANWFGIQTNACAIFAMPAALTVLVVLTVIFPRRTK